MDTTTASTTPFRRHLVALIDVLEDHCKDLDVVMADASAHDIHIALGDGASAAMLAGRLNALLRPSPVDYRGRARIWDATTDTGVQVQISDWSPR